MQWVCTRIQASQGRIVAFYDAQLAEERFAGETWAAQCKRFVKELPAQVYVSFDIDGLDPALPRTRGPSYRAAPRPRWPPRCSRRSRAAAPSWGSNSRR